MKIKLASGTLEVRAEPEGRSSHDGINTMPLVVLDLSTHDGECRVRIALDSREASELHYMLERAIVAIDLNAIGKGGVA